ncbi:ABC transporter permease [Clostridium estertheticum]|uniref:ABC transporter permease n=1 Tax=Clostridium estertheticum TaxID=238834 RepID=A0AA47EL43_9CLOT|nr:ABC transporter permease subunit [Clostridium estertheticum]MBU3156759.1 ABC transporter permease [Clostridium estertheticum]WAG62217.1 ABC transporter permease [Clostridium estertheticum]
MGSFFTLVSIENTKLWKRVSAKVMFLIMIILILAATGIYKYYTVSQKVPNTTTVSQNWKQELQANVALQKIQLKQAEDGKNNISKVLTGSLKKGIAEGEYRISNDIKPESQKSVWSRSTKFSTDAGYSRLIALFVIIACSALVAGEFSEGTMKMMISRPYKRYEILSAKLVATIIYGLELLVATFLLNFIMMGVLFGFNGLGAKEMLWTSSSIMYIPAALKTIIVFVLDYLQVLVYVIIAFAISAISRSRSIATGFSLFLLFVGSTIINMVAMFFSWGQYLPLGMSNFSGFVTSGSSIDGTTLAFALGLSAIYSIIFAFVGYYVFEKRDI